MSVIVIQLGQCGNQIGSQLFSTLHSDALSSNKPTFSSATALPKAKQTSYYQCSVDRFFHERDGHPPLARAVLVDMETKVVHGALVERKRDKQWLYDPASAHQGKKGSGNNWANGYCKQGPLTCDLIMSLVQREVEKCAHLGCFLVLMSVAGGTGSGLGAFVTEKLRDEYPHVTIFNHVVWPYASGEVILQNYNALLTMAHLYESSDAIIVSQNDQLHKICSKLLLMKEITFFDMNRVVSHSLASVLQPAVSLTSFQETAHTSNPLLFGSCSLSDLASNLTPHPDYKLLSVKCVPQIPDHSHDYSYFRWPGLLKHMKQMLITDSPIEEGMDWSLQSSSSHSLATYTGAGSMQSVAFTPRGVNRSLANLVVLRGNELDVADPTLFYDHNLYGSWIPPSQRCRVWCSQQSFNRYEKTCTLVSNSQSCVSPLDTVTGKAWKMFSSRAFVHQYNQFGLSDDKFMECFVTVEQILKNYSSIT